MDLSRQEYPGLLKTLSPTQTVALVNDRVDYISRSNNAIADWLEVCQEEASGITIMLTAAGTQKNRRSLCSRSPKVGAKEDRYRRARIRVLTVGVSSQAIANHR